MTTETGKFLPRKAVIFSIRVLSALTGPNVTLLCLQPGLHSIPGVISSSFSKDVGCHLQCHHKPVQSSARTTACAELTPSLPLVPLASGYLVQRWGGSRQPRIPSYQQLQISLSKRLLTKPKDNRGSPGLLIGESSYKLSFIQSENSIWRWLMQTVKSYIDILCPIIITMSLPGQLFSLYSMLSLWKWCTAHNPTYSSSFSETWI